jgi:hypothetical protein
MLSGVELGSLVLNFIPRPVGGEVYFGKEIVTNHNSQLAVGQEGLILNERRIMSQSFPINAFLTRRAQLLLCPLRILKFENLK